MTDRPNIAAIIVAAGEGSRAGGYIPKQYRLVHGKPLLVHSYEAFARHPAISDIYLVIGQDQEPLAKDCFGVTEHPKLITGGATRQKSVKNALRAIADSPPDLVLIHDAARPFLTAEVIDRLLIALQSHQGAVPVLPIVDSLAQGSDVMAATVEREGLWRVQTPQAFHFDDVYLAHQEWDAENQATDDARMVVAAGFDVALVEGDEALAKYTFARDFEAPQEIPMPPTLFRSGTGYDVHRLVAAEELWLCGMKIDHHSGLSGHSDADVALHALTDAILGALALGDIGDHFPPSDPQWKDASSDRFVAHAMKMARDGGYELSNADITIICEAPKIGPHKLAMRERVADILAVSLDRVSVKATTTERLGFTGQEEGIAAQAVATFSK